MIVFTGDGLGVGIDLADRATWGELIEAEDADQFQAL